MKKVLSLVFVAFVFVFGHASQSLAMGFTDVPENHRFGPHMNFLFNEGIIQGFGDGKFGPDQAVTRGAAAIMLANVLELDTSNPKSGFRDVSESSKAAGAIQAVKAKGIVNGFPDRKFYPDREVTRAEMAILLANAFDLKDKSYPTFTDVSRTMKSYDAIGKVLANGIASGYTAQKYNPNEPLTRAQFSAFLARAMSEEFRLVVKKPGEAKVNTAEAYAIASQLTAEFREKVFDLGEENGWGFQNPGKVDIAKPVLKEYLTEDFIANDLATFVEHYYCDCDLDIAPKMEDRMLRFTLAEAKNGSFSITGLYLSDFITTEPYFQTINFKAEDGKWKIDDWKGKIVTNENLNLTKREVEKAFEDAKVIDEYYWKAAGSNVYELESVHFLQPTGISKKDGQFYLLE